jgi:hypothetical protein
MPAASASSVWLNPNKFRRARIFSPIWASTGVAPLLRCFDDFAIVRNPILHSDDALKLHKPFAASKLPTAPDRPCTRLSPTKKANEALAPGRPRRRVASRPRRGYPAAPRRRRDHDGAAVTTLTPVLSCRSCRPNAPFAELVRLSKSSVAEDFYAEHSGNRWVNE